MRSQIIAQEVERHLVQAGVEVPGSSPGGHIRLAQRQSDALRKQGRRSGFDSRGTLLFFNSLLLFIVLIRHPFDRSPSSVFRPRYGLFLFELGVSCLSGSGSVNSILYYVVDVDIVLN